MKRRILIVDDNAINRKLANVILRHNGWEPVELDNGRDALAMLAGDHAIAAVLLDISMPGLNGDEVCRTLRNDPRTAALPIIAYTAHAMDLDGKRLLAAGFDEILIKPCKQADFLAAIDRALARHGQS